MDNNDVLGHLLKIESEASTLVANAQAEADKRVLEAEQHSHAAYEAQYARAHEKQESALRAVEEKARQEYQAELEACRAQIAGITPDTGRFSALLNKLAAGEV